MVFSFPLYSEVKQVRRHCDGIFSAVDIVLFAGLEPVSSWINQVHVLRYDGFLVDLLWDEKAKADSHLIQDFCFNFPGFDNFLGKWPMKDIWYFPLIFSQLCPWSPHFCWSIEDSAVVVKKEKKIYLFLCWSSYSCIWTCRCFHHCTCSTRHEDEHSLYPDLKEHRTLAVQCLLRASEGHHLAYK